jgi:regulator of sigma E protease
MDFWIKAAQLLLSLSILIVLHELGHFIPARIFKTRVEKFYLFFDAGFSLLKFKKGETEYGIGWLPLGGYVKISGMIDESLDEEQLAAEPQPWEFRSKPAWQRLIIMLGGVTVNLLLGFFIYMMLLFVWGQDYVKPGDVVHGFAVSPIMEELGFQDGDQIMKIDGETPFDVLDVNKEIMFHDAKTIDVIHSDGTSATIAIPEGTDMALFKAGEMQPFSPRNKNAQFDSVFVDLPAKKAGFENGDKVIFANGVPIIYWDEFTEIVKSNKSKEISITVLRGADTLTLNVKPDEKGTIGVQNEIKPEDLAIVSHKDYGFGESIALGFSYGAGTLSDYITQFKFVFTAKGSTGIGGFGAIGGLFPTTWDWQVFWERTAFISIILAFMNILPIPALDGGHVLFLIYEIISGKAPSDKFLTRAQIVGMVILLSLLLYANGLDIYRWITGG